MAKITREEIGEGFYTYAFLREDRSPYYVGKGRGRRAWKGRTQGGRWRPKDPDRILILKKGLTEEEAFRHEKYMIAVFGRKDLGTGILRNLTDGGEGSSGLSAEHRAKLSAAGKGKQHSVETKAKISAANQGEKNPSSKSFVFTSPKGEEFIVTGAFEVFCCEQGLVSDTMRAALRRNCCSPLRNGWRVRRLDKVAP